MKTFLLACCMLFTLHAADPGSAKRDHVRPAKTGRAGDYDDTLQDPATHALIMKYRMRAPAVLPTDNHLGIILCFHGMGGTETSEVGDVHGDFSRLGFANQYLIVGLKSQGVGWKEVDEPLVLRFLEWLEMVYPIDRRRVFIVGNSNGGWMVSWFGGRHHDLFAGITRYCASVSSAPAAKDAATTQTEYYMVHGDVDAAVSVDNSRNMRKSLHDQGYRYVYRELDGDGHGQIMRNMEVRDDVVRWIHALRHKTVPLPDVDVRFLKQFANAAKANELFALPATWDELVRIGGAAAWSTVARAAKHELAAVRLAAAQACARCVFAGDDTVGTLGRLAEDTDAAVRTAAIAALRMTANWHGESAQSVLGKIALNRKTAPDDRSAAAAALSAALTLPLLGNFDDDGVAIRGVVSLLGADLPEVRAAAFTALKAKVPDGLGYDPGADDAARTAPLAAWKNWFSERMASARK